MSEPAHKDKAEEEKPDIKKTREYRRFRKLLKQVVKAPPMRRSFKNIPTAMTSQHEK